MSGNKENSDMEIRQKQDDRLKRTKDMAAQVLHDSAGSMLRLVDAIESVEQAACFLETADKDDKTLDYKRSHSRSLPEDSHYREIANCISGVASFMPILNNIGVLLRELREHLNGSLNSLTLAKDGWVLKSDKETK